VTAPTIAAADADSSKPYCLLCINFPSPVGVKWYAQEDFGRHDGTSWDHAQGRVLEWGTVRVEIKQDKAVNVVGECTIRLRDEDQALWGYFQEVEPQRSWVTIYQQFRGNAAADLVRVHVGIINAPCAWSEKDHAVTLDVTDISTYFDRTVGNFADRLDYPNVVQTDENKLIPLVFGSVKRAKAVAVDFGPVTSLARQVGYYDMGLYVNDAEKFPQDTPTEIWIQGERITGHFHGNFFSVTARGAAVYTGTVTALGMDMQHVVDSALTGADGQWMGYSLQVTTPDGVTQVKFITGYDAASHTLTYGLVGAWKYTDPLTLTTTWFGDYIVNAGAMYVLPIGATYQIVCPRAVHPAGVKVYLARSNYTYVVNDAASKQVYYVEGWGHPIVGSSEEWWVALQPSCFTINRNDTTTCPGRAVTSISFFVPPSQLDTRLRDDDLWVTLDGVETNGDGTGTLLENPADIIQAIHTRWMGMSSANLDAASFARAKSSTIPLKMGFALTQQKQGLELCSDLAFQARCAEVFFAGQAKLIFLTNVMQPAGTPPTTGADRYLGSLDIARREWNQVVTEITGAYVDNAIRETIILRSAAAEAFVGGRRAKTIDFWAYASLPPVQGVAQFWLNRWQYIWQQIALVDSLRRLDAEPYDLFDLDLAAWFGADQVARVIGVEHALGGGAGRGIPGIRLSAEIPYFPEGVCDTLAEAMPPGGCWACENSCQLGCELFCTTGIESVSPPVVTAPATEGHTSLHGTTPWHTPLWTTRYGTTFPTDFGTNPNTVMPTAARTFPPTDRRTTEWWTPEPTGWHTPEPTEAHTSAHTAPHTTGPTSPHTGGPTSGPTAEYGCLTCTGKTPSTIHATLSDGRSATLVQEGHVSPCRFTGILSGGGGQPILVQFASWMIFCTVGAADSGSYSPPSSDGRYDCMATYVVPIELDAGRWIYVTLTPS